MQYLYDFLLFLAKAVVLLTAVAIVASIIFGSKSKGGGEGNLRVRSLNTFYKKLNNAVGAVLLPKSQVKAQRKMEAKEAKLVKKLGLSATQKPKVFVLDFKGDLYASAAENLRHEVTALLSHAKEDDEVLVRLSSPGGTVTGYGLGAAQLARVRDKGIPLTVAVDQVAASGGYMMACIANKIISAPFAMLGSIGVVSQVTNVHRLLKKNDVDVEHFTAGEYKRTVTMTGEITEEGREKYREQLAEIHELFRDHVSAYRPELDMQKIGTGEAWCGTKAMEHGLVDQLMTSDEYLQDKANMADLIHLEFRAPKPGRLKKLMGAELADFVDGFLTRLSSRSSVI
ncbi:serine protease SohB [Pseudomonas nitritireducens]|uniref:Serine protease SohB n=1 Tax=Pseudomonas nitroreducens TaxID=46680 RepID=A0A7W7P3C9_PSENT|nr:protease SohB [Pseudomonas nitritireducens]MBB4866858.1 serine protease SohB [Pseudomonas nitritireducens]